MPTEVLNQLRALREGIAETLRKDPRYLTLTALDKSIVEISGVLGAAGLVPPETPAPSPLNFAPPADAPAPPSLPPSTHPVEKTSLVKPLAEVAAAGAAAEAAHARMGRSAKTPADEAPGKSEAGEADDSEGEPGDAGHDEPRDTSAEGTEPQDTETDVAETDGTGTEETEADGTGTEATEAEETGTEATEAEETGTEATEAEETEAEDTSAEAGEADGADGASEATERVVPEHKATGYMPMAAKPGAARYQPSIAVKFGKLPNRVDLRPFMTPVEDQGETSSCVANAVAGAYEYWIRKASKQDQTVSRLFVYYNARWRDGSQDTDDGSVIQLAMEGLQTFGACNETVWPCDAELVLTKPGAGAYKDGVAHRVQDMQRVPLKLEAWKQALAEGKPIVFGCALFGSFDECSARGGVVSMPSPDDVTRAKQSGHSMCAVGYSDSEKVFIVRNSWGPDWGDTGYCYMPYDYLMNPKFNDGDCWVFVPKIPSQPPREAWSDTTDPVTNGGLGVDFPIADYTIADYEHVVVEYWAKVRRPFNETVAADYADYASTVARGAWTELESLDSRTVLGPTAALTGAATGAFGSEADTTDSSSEVSRLEESEAHGEEAHDEEAHDDAHAGDEAGSDVEGDDAEDEDSRESDGHHGPTDDRD